MGMDLTRLLRQYNALAGEGPVNGLVGGQDTEIDEVLAHAEHKGVSGLRGGVGQPADGDSGRST